MPDYKPTLFERLGLDSPSNLKALGWALPMSALLALLAFAAFLSQGWAVAFLAGALGFVGGIVAIAGGTIVFTHLVARGATSFLLPGAGGGAGSEEEFSRERALVAAGKVDEALRTMERRRAEEPANVALVLLMAETYARDARKPGRAEPLFRAAREMRGVSAERDLYATNRLVDLYLGPLGDRAGAARELRRILERHPKSAAAGEVKRLLEGM